MFEGRWKGDSGFFALFVLFIFSFLREAAPCLNCTSTYKIATKLYKKHDVAGLIN